jgi:hypothetical protein
MFGRSKCRHQWKLAGAKYNPRPEGLRNAKGNDPALVREAIYGITVLTQQCEHCGWIATSRAVGQVDVSSVTSVERQGVEW